MYRKVLIAVDGSKLAEKALPYAEELSSRLGSELILLRVCDTKEECESDETQSYMKGLARRVGLDTDSLARDSGPARTGPAAVQVAVVAGNAASQIIDYAANNNIGLIVMAEHGASGAGRWALGAVAEKVVRGTRIPVAMIPVEKQEEPPRQVHVFRKALVPLDGSKTGEAALPYVEALAAGLSTELVLLQVVEHKYPTYSPEIGGYVPYRQEWITAVEDDARKYLSGMEEKLKAKGIKVSSVLETGAPADRIIDVAGRTGADFIAMSTHGRAGVGRWVFGSVADRVLHSGKLPLVLVRARAES